MFLGIFGKAVAGLLGEEQLTFLFHRPRKYNRE